MQRDRAVIEPLNGVLAGELTAANRQVGEAHYLAQQIRS
jgi:bacterioferritin (cytochrome b1)